MIRQVPKECYTTVEYTNIIKCSTVFRLPCRPKRRLWDYVEEHLVVFWCNTQKSRLTHSCCATRGSFVKG
jgi:hypothetical protein